MPVLAVLNMSSNQLTDPRFDAVPATLQLLYLANNRLTGKLPQLRSSASGNSNLKLLDVSYNNFFGPLPQDLPLNLSIFNISSNAVVGSLPSIWSRLRHLVDLRLDSNQLTGTLPPAWSAWGSNTGNSLQLSVKNTSLHGHIPRQWVQQFCLDIVKDSSEQVLFQPTVSKLPDLPNRYSGNKQIERGPLVVLPAQRASINVTLASKTYTFDYENPDSVCGIPEAVRNVALLWGIFAMSLVTTLLGIWWWQRRKPQPGSQGGCFRHWKLSTVLGYDTVLKGWQVTNRLWFLVSDVGWTIYSVVTDAITIHQVFSSGQVGYAFTLLVILLLPFAVMFILVVPVSIRWCHKKVGSRTPMCGAAVSSLGLLLSPLFFFGIQFRLTIHSIGVPLPTCWDGLDVDVATFYRTQSVAEAFFSALPQSIVQSKLYLMGNDPHGVHVYIDTNLFLISVIGSLFSVLKTMALIAVELHQYGWNLYAKNLVKFDTFQGSTAGLVP